MFGWFAAKCPVDDQTKLWTERRMAWLINEFGWDRVLSTPVILSESEYFPEPYEATEDSARMLLKYLCRYMDIDPAGIHLDFYTGRSNAPLGLYDERKTQVTVWLDISHLEDPVSVVATLAHELGHFHLLGGGRIANDTDDHEPLTDLVTVVFGLGVLVANATIRDVIYHDGNWEYRHMSGQGYLTSPMFGYALALFAWLRDEESPSWARSMRPDVRVPFRKGLRFLKRTGNSTVTRHGDLCPEQLSPLPSQLRNRIPVVTPHEEEWEESDADNEPDGADRTADELFTEAILLMAEGKFQEAVRTLSEAIARSPEDAELYQYRASTLLRIGKSRDALDDAREAVRLDPTDRESYGLRGQSLFEVGDYTRAAEDFSRIIKEEESDAHACGSRRVAYYWRGRILAAQGQLRKALADLKKATTFGPLQAEVYVERSRIYEQLGDSDKAAADRQEAFRLNPALAEQEFGHHETDDQ